MAKRPVFIAKTEGVTLVEARHVEFQWFPGMALSRRQKSIDSFHAAATKLADVISVLEVSSKSRQELGVALSAFNLTVAVVEGRAVSVE